MKKQLLIPIICLSLINNTFAQISALDLSFGSSGSVTTDLGLADDVGNAIGIQSDGKIIVAGYTVVGSYYEFAVTRYNTDGSLDNTFDGDGKVVTSVGPSSDQANAVAIQPDGKILVAGTSYVTGSHYEFAVVRYNSDGSLDNTFSGDGKVVTTFDIYADKAYSVAVQSDGKIVLAGITYNVYWYDVALIRYNADGTLDNTFSGDGKTTIGLNSSSFDVAVSMAIQSDGKIITAGYTDDGGNANFLLLRFNTNGSIDNTFDSDGAVVTSVGANGSANSVLVQSDGKIVAGGYRNDGTINEFAIVRYNANGSLDNTFDTDGKVYTSIGTTSASATSMAIQPDGKILAVGGNYNGFTSDFIIVRYNTDGSLDNDFDGDGKVTISRGQPQSVALQADGKIIVAGYTTTGAKDFSLVRCIENPVVSALFDNEENSFSFEIYPNPAKKAVSIISEKRGASVRILDLSGHLIQEGILEQSTLDIDGLKSGVYIVEVMQNGNKESKKLLIE